MSLRIGIDIGGTKIEAVAIDETGREIVRRRVATPAGDYPATLAAIAGLVAGVEHACGRKGSVGVGMPGTISPASGRVKNSNSLCLLGQALDRDLERALARPVRLANDADCFALSEAADGAAAGARSVFGVILGTGVGGGLVYEGRLIAGANAIAGEWGHNPLPWPRPWPHADERPGPACYCGRSGCIETFLSGPGLARDHRLATGQSMEPADIAAAAQAGDQAADASLARYVDRLARALACVINIFDPYVIVLGGGLSRLPRLYSQVPERWTDGVFSNSVDTKLVPPKHGDSSGVRGAARLWPANGA
ncbi:MAG: ROK family protein [Pseudomonadota bacterium]